MADTTDIEEEMPKKRSKIPLLLGLVLGLSGAGGGFYTVYSGMILGADGSPKEMADSHEEETKMAMAKGSSKVAFLPMDPLVVSLNTGESRHLRFRAQLEVEEKAKEDVMHLMPRVVDVLNGYLRALELSDLQNNAALVRLRAQMLRRVQVVTGGTQVKDLLIMEFVLN